MLLLAPLPIPAGKARRRSRSTAQLAAMEHAQVIMESIEGEGPRPQENGRKRRKPILPTVLLWNIM